MAKDPAFLFYPSDFLTGVADLTMEERGQYITMMCLQHQKGGLSDKTIRLTLGSVSVDVLNKFKVDEQGNYYNERLSFEIEKRTQFVESRRVNGKKGGRPIKTTRLAYAKHMGNLPINENIDTNNKDITSLFSDGIVTKESPSPDLYSEYLSYLNTKLSKRMRGGKNERAAFAARIKDGYTLEDFKRAIDAAVNEQFHKDNGYKWLTVEFFTRSVKLDMWANAVTVKSDITTHPAYDKMKQDRIERLRHQRIPIEEQRDIEYLKATGQNENN